VEPQRLYSLRLVNWHFWLATIGIVLLRRVDVGHRHHGRPDVARVDAQGFLVNSFADTVAAMHPDVRGPWTWAASCSSPAR
jgi:cytochrome c oxidase cbb3-type subunit 1